MIRRALAFAAVLAACAAAWAEPPGPWILPAAPETPLLSSGAEAATLATLRSAALAGQAGGMALTAWGLAGAAGAFADGGSRAELHRGLALALWGTVVAAVFSALSGAAAGP